VPELQARRGLRRGRVLVSPTGPPLKSDDNSSGRKTRRFLHDSTIATTTRGMGSTLRANPPMATASRTDTVIDVRTLGAKGDGVTNDHAAIARAFAAAAT
jgi:polygalacturonase